MIDVVCPSGADLDQGNGSVSSCKFSTFGPCPMWTSIFRRGITTTVIRRVCTLDPALGLTGIGTENLDVQFR
jgi:hypothetical protein